MIIGMNKLIIIRVGKVTIVVYADGNELLHTFVKCTWQFYAITHDYVIIEICIEIISKVMLSIYQRLRIKTYPT